MSDSIWNMDILEVIDKIYELELEKGFWIALKNIVVKYDPDKTYANDDDMIIVDNYVAHKLILIDDEIKELEKVQEYLRDKADNT